LKQVVATNVYFEACRYASFMLYKIKRLCWRVGFWCIKVEELVKLNIDI